MNNNEEFRKCTACKIDRPLIDYISKAGRPNLKNCQRCRYLKGQKCKHGYRQKTCEECTLEEKCTKHGNVIKSRCALCKNIRYHEIRCSHNKLYKSEYCSICGFGLCPHKKPFHNCKNCSDPKKITITRMIVHSKEKDIKYNRYDANNFIDKCFIEILIEESMKCHYCKKEMQLIEFNDELCTIERLDNNVGHIKSNCVLACKECNNKHKNAENQKKIIDD